MLAPEGPASLWKASGEKNKPALLSLFLVSPQRELMEISHHARARRLRWARPEGERLFLSLSLSLRSPRSKASLAGATDAKHSTIPPPLWSSAREQEEAEHCCFPSCPPSLDQRLWLPL